MKTYSVYLERKVEECVEVLIQAPNREEARRIAELGEGEPVSPVTVCREGDWRGRWVTEMDPEHVGPEMDDENGEDGAHA